MLSSDDTTSQTPRAGIASYLAGLATATDLTPLLLRPFYVNPSDLFDVVLAEIRLRNHSADRTVSMSVFLAALYHHVLGSLNHDRDWLSAQKNYQALLAAVVKRYNEPTRDDENLVNAISILTQDFPHTILHEAFRYSFRDWRKMIGSARLMPRAKELSLTTEYGVSEPGVILADRIGNMLSHVRYLYCDRAFPHHLIRLD